MSRRRKTDAGPRRPHVPEADFGYGWRDGALQVAVRPEHYVLQLRVSSWPDIESVVEQVVDDAAGVGDPSLALFFLAVGALLDPDDEEPVGRLGVGSLQEWLAAADRFHPDALDVVLSGVHAAPALRRAMEQHMLFDLRTLRSDAGRRLAAAVNDRRADGEGAG